MSTEDLINKILDLASEYHDVESVVFDLASQNDVLAPTVKSIRALREKAKYYSFFPNAHIMREKLLQQSWESAQELLKIIGKSDKYEPHVSRLRTVLKEVEALEEKIATESWMEYVSRAQPA